MSKSSRVSPLLALAAAAALALAGGQAAAQVPAQAQARLRALYQEGAFAARSFRADWLPDGSGYARLERVEGAAGRALVRYDPASGRRTVLVSPSQLVPPGAAAPLAMESYALSPDPDVLLFSTNSRPDEDGRGRVGEYWTLERSSGALHKVAEGVVSGSLDGAFSPDGRHILFPRGGDLYVTDRSGAHTVRLTHDGSDEAISNRGGVWSPDGRRIAFVRSDASHVRIRKMLEPGDPSYPEVRELRFARVGGTIATLRVGVVGVEGGETTWLPIPSPEEGFYLGALSWAGNAHQVLVEQRSRGRDARAFLIADTRTGSVTPMYHESDPAWVIASYRTNGGLEWIRGGRAFVLLTEKDGWRHAYVYARSGEELALLTPGNYDVIERGRVDDAGGWFYYYASPDNATQRYLYRVRLDGTGTPERVTPADQPGTHTYQFSPDMRWAFHTYSTFDTPPLTELVALPSHRVVRGLEDNKALRDRVTPALSRASEFVKLDIGGGVVMDAWMIKPRDFDPSRSYPLFVYVYGEPHAQTVLDRWSGNQIYHQTIADLGYVVVSIDNRGTPAPKGAAWRRAIFGSLGPLSTEEQAAGVLELGRTRPWIDLSRVGVWGWSGGGSNTLNAMFRRPDVFKVGIAVAPKPQPHLYNAWFQEIYMRTREQNPEGYRRSAPINFAEGLRGDLLIIQGTGETNTHIQITEGLVDRLIALGKPFDYMTYPNRDHGISRGEGTSLHMRLHMVRYLLAHLPPGPRAN